MRSMYVAVCLFFLVLAATTQFAPFLIPAALAAAAAIMTDRDER